MSAITQQGTSSSSSPPPPPPTTLILVCCHAIFTGPTISTTPLDPYDPTQWLLQSFQKSESPTFINHIQTGLDLLRQNSKSILVFSGGRTRSGEGVDVSEAEGYKRVARWLLRNEEGQGKQEGENLMRRVFLEEWATDSFQNVLFGLLSWGIWIGNYGRGLDERVKMSVQDTDRIQSFHVLPRKLFLVSHEFKKPRFMDLHLPAIQELLPTDARVAFDAMEVEYIGINPPFSCQELQGVEAGERTRGYEPWIMDRFGLGAILSGKRVGRGWDITGEAYLKWWRDKLGQGEEVAMGEVRRMVNEGSERNSGTERPRATFE